MSNDKNVFHDLKLFDVPQNVTLGDGRSLKAIAEGKIIIETLLPDGNTRQCVLNNFLLIPGLSYNLLSVSNTSVLEALSNSASQDVKYSITKERILLLLQMQEICFIWNIVEKLTISMSPKITRKYFGTDGIDKLV